MLEQQLGRDSRDDTKPGWLKKLRSAPRYRPGLRAAITVSIAIVILATPVPGSAQDGAAPEKSTATGLESILKAIAGRAAAEADVLESAAVEQSRTPAGAARSASPSDADGLADADQPGDDPPARDPEPGAVKSVEPGLYDIHVRDAEISGVLEMLSYQARTNIVAGTSVNGAISANLYSVSLPEALDAILRPHQFGWRKVKNTIFVGTPEELASHSELETRVFKLRYLSKEEAIRAVQPMLGKSGKAVASGAAVGGMPGGASGGSAGSPGGSAMSASSESGPAGADFLVVTDAGERLDRIEELLDQIDERPRQVLIEATILRATLNEQNQFGIDFTVLGGIDFQNVGSTSDASTNLQTGPLPPNLFERATANVNTNLIGNIPGGFTFGLINNGVAAFIKALEEVTDVSVVANPKVMALNRQESQVIVGRRDGYITTTVTETAAVQTVEFLATGTQIRLRPIINEDGAVRLRIHPKDSNGGLTAANLPFEETTEAQADVLVKDGNTILIGGLFRERTLNSRSQVPVLGNIPLVGLAFQKLNNQTIREEVIILLTVHVLKDTPDEDERFANLNDEMERVRVGMRRGLLGTGRERLAQAYFQEALKQYEEGCDERALFNVRMTLHNQPKHLAALKLKEDILGRRQWDDEGAPSRLFLMDMIRGPGRREEAGPEGDLLGRPSSDVRLYRDPTPRRAASPEVPAAPRPAPHRPPKSMRIRDMETER